MRFYLLRYFSVAAMCACVYSAAQTARPLPDTPTLIQQVQDHQRELDKIRENYTYREIVVTHELDKNGSVKKEESEENNVFFVNGREIQSRVKKNGIELNPDDLKKEQDRAGKEAEKASKMPPGQAQDKDTISVTRLLQIMKVSAPRRETMDNRSVIAFDFVGDPHAKTHGMAEDASKKLSGTMWIDEKDRQVRRITAHFDDNFHLGFGFFSIGKGSVFTFNQKLVNNEIWLPTDAQIHFIAHAIGILGVRADIAVTDKDYQRFHTDAEQQPGATVVPQK